MNKKKRISISVIIILLFIYIVNIPRIYGNYMELPGIYKATYNFYNDETGTVPEDWSKVSPNEENSIQIIETFEDHNKVVEYIREEESSFFEHHISSEEEIIKGTIEWYWATTDVQTSVHFQIRGSGEGIGRIMLISLQKGQILGSPVIDNEWIHIRVDFDCTKQKWSLYVDGDLIRDDSPFSDEVSELNRIMFYSDPNSVTFIDAVGFSWDHNYEIGDNLHLDKIIHPMIYMGYILFSIVIIISYIVVLNPKVSLPLAVRFLVKREIIKKMKYIQIFNFIFLIFKKKLVVENKKWDVYEAANTSIEVISELDGHREVIEIFDNTILGRGYIRNSNPPNQESGSIEWYWRITNTSKRVYFSLINSDLYGMVSIKIENGNIYACDSKNHQRLHEININQWYYMRVDFECATNTFDLYINETKKAYQFNFRYPSTYPQFTQFYTDMHQYGYHVYVSDVSYSWDDGSEIRDVKCSKTKVE